MMIGGFFNDHTGYFMFLLFKFNPTTMTLANSIQFSNSNDNMKRVHNIHYSTDVGSYFLGLNMNGSIGLVQLHNNFTLGSKFLGPTFEAH